MGTSRAMAMARLVPMEAPHQARRPTRRPGLQARRIRSRVGQTAGRSRAWRTRARAPSATGPRRPGPREGPPRDTATTQGPWALPRATAQQADRRATRRGASWGSGGTAAGRWARSPGWTSSTSSGWTGCPSDARMPPRSTNSSASMAAGLPRSTPPPRGVASSVGADPPGPGSLPAPVPCRQARVPCRQVAAGALADASAIGATSTARKGARRTSALRGSATTRPCAAGC